VTPDEKRNRLGADETRPKIVSWETTRAPYTWHLRPPFGKDFDRSYWWKQTKEDPESEGALYELARRHPLVGELRLRVHHTRWHKALARGESLSGPLLRRGLADFKADPEPIRVLCLIGLKSWRQLSEQDRRLWSSAAGKTKGVDCRTDIEACYCLANPELERVMWPSDPLKPGLVILYGLSKRKMSKRKMLERIFSDPLEAEVAQRAIEAHRQGYVLMAVASDLEPDRAKALLFKTYRHYRVMARTITRRARSGNWLDLICEFEGETLSKGQAKSDVFIHYQRVIDSISW